MEYTDAIAVPIIVAVTEIFKGLGLSSKYAPILSLILGVVFAGLFMGFAKESLLTGAMFGLASSGLYSGGKTLIKK